MMQSVNLETFTGGFVRLLAMKTMTPRLRFGSTGCPPGFAKCEVGLL